MEALEYYNRLETGLKNSNSIQDLQAIWSFNPGLRYQEDVALVKAELQALYENKVSQFGEPDTGLDFSGELQQFRIKPWFAKDNNIFPVFEGKVIRETQKAVLVRGRAMTTPSSRCRHCNREIAHPVSIKYGLGIICGEHYGVDPSGESVESIRARLAVETAFEKWMPKAVVLEISEIQETN